MAYKKGKKAGKYAGRAKRVTSADKLLHKQRMGDRPCVDQKDDLSLAKALNWYNSLYEDPQQAYDAVLHYLIESGVSTDKWIANKSTLMKHVTSHYWAMADMINNGDITDTAMINRFRRQIKKLLQIKPEPAPPAPRVVTAEDRAHHIIAHLEDEWDKCVNLIYKKLKPKFNYGDFVRKFNVTSDVQPYITAYYRRLHQEYVDAYKDRIEGYENLTKGQLKVMVEIMTQICTGTAPPPPAPPKRKSYYKPKGTRGKTKIKNRKMKAPPPAFDGKRAAIIFYPEQNQIGVLFAEGDQKLIVKKKTILNVDLNKSYVKRFGKQKDMVKKLRNSKSFDKVLQFVSTVSSAKMPATTRLRDSAIVVNMKE